MAKLAPGIGFTGSLNNLSAYRMRGHDEIILRMKGGPSKKMIKRSPSFEQTRRNNMEFGGRSTAAGWIMRGLHPHKSLADYNIAGPLQAILKPIQLLDDKTEFGKRNVCLSKNPGLLGGFSLNRKTIFDSVMRSPLHVEISRSELTATINLPALVPGINFFASPYHPLFRISLSLAVVPDLFHDAAGYKAAREYDHCYPHKIQGEWFTVSRGCGEQSFEIEIDRPLPDENFSLVLSTGICYGELMLPASPQQVKYAGAAKILAVV
jgi:hypothetical protein